MNLDILLASQTGLDAALGKPARHLPFADPLVNFIGAFSARVLGDHGLRRYPDLMALAFWMRPAHLKQLQEQFETSGGQRLRVPRGLVFHLAPANVDTLFAYSLLLALLLGNRNLVRLSRRDNLVQGEILGIFRELLQQPEFAELADHLLLVRYGHDEEITSRLSEQCDCRVIWGGDETVRRISALPLPPTATEIKFANKWSLALLDAPTLLQLDENKLGELAHGFSNDCYWYGQAACSSPRAVFWRGEIAQITRAQERFWPAVEAQLQTFDHRLQAADFVNKLVVCCEIAADNQCTVAPAGSNLVTRIQLAELIPQLLEKHCGGGLFYEVSIAALAELEPVLSRQIQTLACFGFDPQELRELVGSVPAGFDRIVPVGQALDFDVRWDGYDLFESLTRGVNVPEEKI